MEDVILTLERVIFTLNQIDVHGEDNMDKLLGCARAVRGAVAKLRQGEQPAADPQNSQE